MDTRTGEIFTPEEWENIKQIIYNTEDEKHFKIMKIDPTSKQLKNKKVSRNDFCPCGSGKKFKKCCLTYE